MGTGTSGADDRFDRAVERHAGRVAAFLAQLVRDRALAEDLLQETLLAAYRDRARLAAVEDEAAWLLAIARNRALDAQRRRRRHRAALERLGRARRPPAPDPVEATAVRDVLERELSPDERALLILRYLHGFDSTELGEVFGASPEAIRQRLSRTPRGPRPSARCGSRSPRTSCRRASRAR